MKRRDLLLLGGTMTVARDLRAQQKTIPVIGFLAGTSDEPVRVDCGRVPPGTERSRLCRGTKRGNRIPVG